MLAPTQAVPPTASPQVQRRKSGPAPGFQASHHTLRRRETCAHTFGGRLPPCPGVPSLGAPGPQLLWLLRVPPSRPTRGNRHACVLSQRSSQQTGVASAQLVAFPGEQRGVPSRRRGPDNRHFLTFYVCGRKRHECQAQGNGQTRWAGADRQAARPPTTAASLKPEPLLGTLKDSILLSSKQCTQTTNSEPNSH